MMEPGTPDDRARRFYEDNKRRIEEALAESQRRRAAGEVIKIDPPQLLEERLLRLQGRGNE